MKNILIPTDFSDNAYKAISYAVRLLKDETCTFHLLHTYTPAIYQSEYLLHSPGQLGLGDIYRTDSETKLEDLKQKVISQFNNPKHIFKTYSAFSVLMEAIDELVESKKIDLLIMGTQGATGAKEIFLGSSTVHTIKRAKCPVLAIPFDFDIEMPTKILFPTDYEIEYNFELIKQVLFIAKVHKSTMDIMHVRSGYELSEEQKKNKGKLDHLLAETKHKFHELPDQGIIEAINSIQAELNHQMLVMVKNKHSFLENLFLKPVINQIGFHSNIPFMVLPYQLLG
ncbi:Nucleotide-binding universal stress protein, UspA family [Arenibacter palladensis]|uniref:Nucleotide-binding universal stress protein, UspA family n=1 Tax=Arenibacter palladensis TaxID=237373 RepID=A0A1M5AFQ4_9FLAO|nr:universal stress protein [Arenibacter palladensis]SHF28987.1 Nucleotide-binding universal stress protein, UspA family [Arenibacter palladensis]